MDEIGAIMIIEVVNELVIIALSIIIIYYNIKFYFDFYYLRKRYWMAPWYAIIGFIWAAVFIYSLPTTNEHFLWHAAVVRPALTVTLAGIASNAITRDHAYRHRL